MFKPIWSSKDSVISIFVVPLVTGEDMFGYHGNHVTTRKYFGLSSNRTL